MKFLVVLAVAVATTAAADVFKPSDDYQVPIIKSSYDITPDGNSFQYEYEAGNGIAAQASGAVKNPNSDTPTLEVRGSYKYPSPDGSLIQAEYVANEDGFQVTGDHIPVPPPIPEAIARSLAYIAANRPLVAKTV